MVGETAAEHQPAAEELDYHCAAVLAHNGDLGSGHEAHVDEALADMRPTVDIDHPMRALRLSQCQGECMAVATAMAVLSMLSAEHVSWPPPRDAKSGGIRGS